MTNNNTQPKLVEQKYPYNTANAIALGVLEQLRPHYAEPEEGNL